MQNRPLVGMAWMVGAGASFVCFNTVVKTVGPELPTAVGAFFRFAFGFILLIPLAGTIRRHWPARADLRLFTYRGLVHALAILCWFFAMARLPIAEVTAINYLNPIFVTIGAMLFLGETLALRRILAIACAFLGVLVVLRPGLRELEPAHLAMLLVTVCLGASYLIGKSMSDRFPSEVIVAWLTLAITPMLLPLAILHWQTPTLAQSGLLALTAVFANLGHYCMTRAFQSAPVAVTQPAIFLQLVGSVFVGLWVFGDPLDGYVILGGAIIVAAVSFIAWREHVLKHRSAT